MKFIDNLKTVLTFNKKGYEQFVFNSTPIMGGGIFNSIQHSTEELCFGTVYSCIDFRAKSLAKSIPIMYKNNEAEDNPEIENHEFLNVLETPNPNLSKAELMINTLANMDVYGNAYWLLLKTKKFNSLREIHILHPKYTRIRIDNNTGMVSGYDYTFNNGVANVNTFYPVQDIIHFKHQNYLNNGIYGMSIIQQNALVLNIYLEMTLYQSNFLKNNALPKFVLKHNRSLTPVQIESLKEQFSGLYGGSSNAGKVPVLENNLDLKPISLSPQELDFQNSYKAIQKSIFEMFQVPAVLLGTSETVNRSTSTTHLTSFYVNTIEPLLNIIDEKINLYLKYNYKKDNIFLKFKLPDVIDADLESKNIQFGVTNGILSKEEYRRFLHYSSDIPEGTYVQSNNNSTNNNSNLPDIIPPDPEQPE